MWSKKKKWRLQKASNYDSNDTRSRRSRRKLTNGFMIFIFYKHYYCCRTRTHVVAHVPQCLQRGHLHPVIELPRNIVQQSREQLRPTVLHKKNRAKKATTAVTVSTGVAKSQTGVPIGETSSICILAGNGYILLLLILAPNTHASKSLNTRGKQASRRGYLSEELLKWNRRSSRSQR